MKTHARVVVIGGGIAGCSTLYHLTQEGWSDVVLLERDELRIKLMLKRHLNYTNSFKAKSILNDFENCIKKFYKVLPIDFKRALQQNIKSDDLKRKEKMV